MNEHLTLKRLRTFLHGLTAALLLGTIAELILVGHAETLVQIIPFVLCGLGLLALAAVWVRPSRGTVLLLRITMAAVALGSLVGMVEHVEGNLEFGRETQPNAGTTQLLVAALTGGNPLLAPGVLAVTAALAVAATYSTDEQETWKPARGNKV